LADDGYAGGVDQEAGFYAGGVGYGAACVVAGVVIPLGEGGERVGQGTHKVGDFGVFPEFCFAGFFDFEIVAEEGTRPGREIGEEADARAQQVDGFRKPLVTWA